MLVFCTQAVVDGLHVQHQLVHCSIQTMVHEQSKKNLKTYFINAALFCSSMLIRRFVSTCFLRGFNTGNVCFSKIPIPRHVLRHSKVHQKHCHDFDVNRPFL